MIFQSKTAENQARRVLYVIDYLAMVVRSGDRVSERQVSILTRDFLELLHDVGGFEDVVRQYHEHKP